MMGMSGHLLSFEGASFFSSHVLNGGWVTKNFLQKIKNKNDASLFCFKLLGALVSHAALSCMGDFPWKRSKARRKMKGRGRKVVEKSTCVRILHLHCGSLHSLHFSHQWAPLGSSSWLCVLGCLFFAVFLDVAAESVRFPPVCSSSSFAMGLSAGPSRGTPFAAIHKRHPRCRVFCSKDGRMARGNCSSLRNIVHSVQ